MRILFRPLLFIPAGILTLQLYGCVTQPVAEKETSAKRPESSAPVNAPRAVEPSESAATEHKELKKQQSVDETAAAAAPPPVVAKRVPSASPIAESRNANPSASDKPTESTSSQESKSHTTSSSSSPVKTSPLEGKQIDSSPVTTPEAPVEIDSIPKEIVDVAAVPDDATTEPELAMVVPKAPPDLTAATPPAAQTTPLNLASLPLTFADQWSLDIAPNPFDGKTQCILSSRSINISDGYERTDVQLLLTHEKLYAATQSNVDLSYPKTGLLLENGTLFSFDGLANPRVAMIGSEVTMLYERLLYGGTLMVRLGFWPTWPVTRTQEANFSLDGFPDAFRALLACEQI